MVPGKYTRVALLKDIEVWLKGSINGMMTWISCYAGSGKSASLNSMAKKLEDAQIPFTVVMMIRSTQMSNAFYQQSVMISRSFSATFEVLP